MRVFKGGRLLMIISVIAVFGIAFLGCATTKQLKAVEEKADRALQQSETASMDAASAKAGVEDSSRYSREAAAGGRSAEAAAGRAEKAAVRAENAARAAERAANRADAAVRKCEEACGKLTAK